MHVAASKILLRLPPQTLFEFQISSESCAILRIAFSELEFSKALDVYDSDRIICGNVVFNPIWKKSTLISIFTADKFHFAHRL